MKGLTSEQLAYIAGLFDGEGTLVIGKYFIKRQVNPAYRGFMAITNTHVPTLQYVKSLIGGKIVQQGMGRKCYSLSLSANEIRNVLPELLPYFSIKKDQAEVMLKFLEKQASRNFGLLSKEHLEYCEYCYLTIKRQKLKRYDFKEKVFSLGIKKCTECEGTFEVTSKSPKKRYCSEKCAKHRRWTFYNGIVRERNQKKVAMRLNLCPSEENLNG